ncbi:MAG: dUTP pyrophosphatase [Chloroflexi bacterium]|nr:MAG: dUTP pyrophosphatase [Chloroflexota bacterium]
MPLRYAKLTPEAVSPTRKHPTDAGVDVCSVESLTVLPFSFRVVHTGLTFEVPPGSMLEIRPKGRNNHLIGSGIVDAGYQGEILVKVVNYSWKPLRIHTGESIAQLVQVPVICEEAEEVDGASIHAKESQRGASGGIHLEIK